MTVATNMICGTMSVLHFDRKLSCAVDGARGRQAGVFAFDEARRPRLSAAAFQLLLFGVTGEVLRTM